MIRHLKRGLPRICATGVAAILLACLNAPPGQASAGTSGSPFRSGESQTGAGLAEARLRTDRMLGLPTRLAPGGPRPGRLLPVGPRAADPLARMPTPIELRNGRVAHAELIEPTQPYVPVTSTAIRIRFDRPVNQPKVTRSFQIEPPLPGTAIWEDGRTLLYKAESLAYDTTYAVRLAATDPEDEVVGGWQWTFLTVKPITVTLDDCGSYNQLKTVLSVLAQKHIKAIMFPIGWCAAVNPWLVPQMLAEGHQVCNHTYSHPRLTYLNDAQMAAEIRSGVHAGCNLLRPPDGNWDGPGGRVERIAASLGYQIFMWDVDTRDYAGASTAEIMAAIRARGGVILMHFHGKNTIEALKQL